MMTPSKSILSYTDAREVFERAAGNTKGVILRFRQGEKARDFFMFRLWEFRKLDRKENRVLYPDPAHTMHGKSFFDTFSVKKIGTDGIEVFKVNLDEVEVTDV